MYSFNDFGIFYKEIQDLINFVPRIFSSIGSENLIFFNTASTPRFNCRSSRLFNTVVSKLTGLWNTVYLRDRNRRTHIPKSRNLTHLKWIQMRTGIQKATSVAPELGGQGTLTHHPRLWGHKTYSPSQFQQKIVRMRDRLHATVWPGK